MDTKKILIVIAIILGIVVVVAAFNLMSETPDFDPEEYTDPLDEEPFVDDEFEFDFDEDMDEDEEDEEEEEEEEEVEEEEEEEEELE